MKIGIIGAGFVGRAVGKLAVAKGHEVMLSNSRGPQSLFSLPYAIGCQIGTVEEAVDFADIVIVAIPLSAYRSVPVTALAGKIVIDTNNYYPERDGQIAELDEQLTTTSELLAQHLPGSHVVKALNSIKMINLETASLPADSLNRQAIPIAGDHQPAKAVVTTLLDDLGFDVVDVGPLSQGWRFERDRPVYCVALNKENLAAALTATVRK